MREGESEKEGMICFRLATLLHVFAGLLAASTAASGGAENKSPAQRIFAYMDTRNADGTKKRTHVFALTTQGTLARRFTSKIDEWRLLSEDPKEPFRYNRTLEFPSPKERNSRVVRLYNDIIEYNKLASEYFEREGKVVPQDNLMIIQQRFGPNYPAKNQYLPTRAELNRLHEKFALLLGPGQGNPRTPVWGDWNKRLHHEMIEWMGIPREKVEKMNVNVFNAKDEDHAALWKNNHNALVVRMFDLLEDINARIHAVEAVGPWAVHTRFTFNNMKLGPLLHKHEMFEPEDYEPDRWHMAMEMGGLYMAYAKTGKNLYACFVDNDIGSLKHHKDLNTIQFQEGFYPEMYVYWGLGNETEAGRRKAFKSWWDKNDLTGTYGWELGKKSEPNGFIRLGQQVCYPSSDCDRPWLELLDEFAETPHVKDIRFSTDWPYGQKDDHLRFMYPGDEMVSKEQSKRWWPVSTVYTPPVVPWKALVDDLKGWWFSKPWPWNRSVEIITIDDSIDRSQSGVMFAMAMVGMIGASFVAVLGYGRVSKGISKKDN